ncbi:nucleotide-sugar transporter [Basidiobolus meristosporus CBS 931.73]|uniref:Nucleotide-sugar transporter n=1 Tax=Basidiobolus meristosporus CBS 931.73 TaxID=1314790 RepID=A0A1Y1YS23_9FUNG|nr:nucleotide-sugar transporter [Basidiobolus meristosporus CBS 931.73]|eukprot:ORY00831.1 nucleotide-sugar transporter [Basidiobolus meristosporus CBS 931.73]
MKTLLPTPSTSRVNKTSNVKKYLSLCFLTIQSSTLVLMLRYSRVVHQPEQPMYIASTAVFFAELIKTIVCLLFLFKNSGKTSIFFDTLSEEVFGNWPELKRMMVPSGLYALQNNLLFLALSNLEAATFQISYQLKILSTALFSVMLLGTQLSRNRWLSLILLMVGVILVQLPSNSEASTMNEDESITNLQNPLIGFGAVIAACLSSGFAGCYFEKIIKKGGTSMWIRNIQLGIPALVFSTVAMIISDGRAIMQGGILQGYDTLTWLVVINQALSGLLVALVVKYAGNILKGFANSLSIIISSLISFYVFGFQPSSQFTVGAFIVIAATLFYSRP